MGDEQVEQRLRKRNRPGRTGIAAALLALAAYGSAEAGGLPFDDMDSQMAGFLTEQSGQIYLPAASYPARGERARSVSSLLAGCVDLLAPAGLYAQESQGLETDVEDAATYEMILAREAGDGSGAGADESQAGSADGSAKAAGTSGTPIDTSIEKMSDFDYLLSNFYTVDSTTVVRPDELNGADLLGRDMKIKGEGEGPKILIYHTHSQETFADSVPGDASTSIVGMGDYLTDLLNDTYGIPTLHHTGVYDLIDGKLDRSLAYDLAKPDLEKILAENPSIEVVIDLHRDGVNEGTRLVTEVNGKQTAQIMFFNGLSKTRANGEIDYLANPYIQDNLAFSLQMQVAANNKYPGFTRRIYLRGYRYNMHFMPKSLLVEAGAQTNTVEEMRNAMEVLADILHIVLTGS